MMFSTLSQQQQQQQNHKTTKFYNNQIETNIQIQFWTTTMLRKNNNLQKKVYIRVDNMTKSLNRLGNHQVRKENSFKEIRKYQKIQKKTNKLFIKNIDDEFLLNQLGFVKKRKSNEYLKIRSYYRRNARTHTHTQRYTVK